MFCGYCGNELKEGARFCGKCGAPVEVVSNDGELASTVPIDVGAVSRIDMMADTAPMGSEAASQTANTTNAAPNAVGAAGAAGGANQAQGQQMGFAGQMEADRKRSRKKLSPLMIIVIVLALLAGTAFAAVLVVSQANQGEQPASQQTPTAASGSAESAPTEQSSTSAESAPAEQVETVDPEQVRAEAREAAIAEGKQVFTGTIMSTTDEEAWVMSIGQNPNAGPYYTERPVTILFLDEKTTIEGFDPTAHSNYKTLQNQDVIELPDSYASYDGQRVDMAFAVDDLTMPSDVSHIKGDGEIIYAEGSTGSGSVAAPASTSTSSASGDYVLPDSATKRYSRQELEKYDDHTLFLARNEIYARHGRKFDSSELQQHFGSKSWYRGTIDPSNFSDDMLSDVERANVNQMLEIEQSRGSAYI